MTSIAVLAAGPVLYRAASSTSASTRMTALAIGCVLGMAGAMLIVASIPRAACGKAIPARGRFWIYPFAGAAGGIVVAILQSSLGREFPLLCAVGGLAAFETAFLAVSCYVMVFERSKRCRIYLSPDGFSLVSSSQQPDLQRGSGPKQ